MRVCSQVTHMTPLHDACNRFQCIASHRTRAAVALPQTMPGRLAGPRVAPQAAGGDAVAALPPPLPTRSRLLRPLVVTSMDRLDIVLGLLAAQISVKGPSVAGVLLTQAGSSRSSSRAYARCGAGCARHRRGSAGHVRAQAPERGGVGRGGSHQCARTYGLRFRMAPDSCRPSRPPCSPWPCPCRRDDPRRGQAAVDQRPRPPQPPAHPPPNKTTEEPHPTRTPACWPPGPPRLFGLQGHCGPHL